MTSPAGRQRFVRIVFGAAWTVHAAGAVGTGLAVNDGALGSYTRPVGLFLYALWLVVALWVWALWRKGDRRDALLVSMMLGVSVCIGALRVPWAGFGPITVFASIAIVATTMDPPFAVGAIVGASLAAAAMLAAIGEAASAVSVVLLALAVVPAAVARWRLEARLESQSRQADQARWAASELPGVLLRVEDSIKRAQAESARSERIRVAREVHDTVGYSLTAVAVQLRVAREMVDSPDVKGRLEQLEQLVRLTLKDIREQVTSLRNREDDEPAARWSARWQRLCGSFADSTRVRINAEIDPVLSGVDDSIGEVIYRILQESLTNAYRHGRATYVHVQMKWRKDLGQILLHVSDNGIGAGSLSPGNGLKGIQERVAALHGVVAWDTLAGKGFDIGVDIPWSGAS